MADYYDLLGVPRTASQEEIKKAYRRRARELHPDANPGDAEAEERFKSVVRAYEVLSDPEQRARYDRYGEAGVSSAATGGDPFMGGITDLFDAFFGATGFGGRAPSSGRAGPPRGQDLEVVADITFEQAVFGGPVPVTVRTAVVCEECGGTGARSGTKPVTCADCNGTGQVRRVRQSILGQMVTAGPCPRCGGLGEVIVTPCAACRGDGRIVADRTYTIDVPAGVDTGSTLRLPGRGAVGPRGGGFGDLYVHVRVAPHDRLRREGVDLVLDERISIAQAALGTRLVIPTLEGDEELEVAGGIQHGTELRLRGRGVPHLEGRGRGDLLVRFAVDVPTKLSTAEEDLLRQYAATRGEEVLPPGHKGLFSRIKSAFS